MMSKSYATFFTLTTLLIACLFSLKADETRLSAKEKPGITEDLIKYSSPTQTIELSDTNVVYRLREMAFKNPTSATPTKVVTVTKETSVSSSEVEKVFAFIRSTKFFDLQDEYGAMPNQRHYSYSIQVKESDREKRVIYRSSPTDEKPPEDFFKVEKYLVEFAKEATTVTRSP